MKIKDYNKISVAENVQSLGTLEFKQVAV